MAVHIRGGFLLNFIFFSTEDFFDRLTVTNGPDIDIVNETVSLSGNIAPDITYVFNHRVLTLTFTSDSSVVRTGFEAVITAADTSSVCKYLNLLLQSIDQ